MQQTAQHPAQRAWKRWRRNRPAVLGMVWIVLISVTALLGYAITPDGTPDCNNQMVRIQLQSPNFSTAILYLEKDHEIARKNIFSRMLYGQVSQYRTIPVESCVEKDNTLDVVAFGGDKMELPKPKHWEIKHKTFWLGTDNYGRDILSRLILGARVSLIVGMIAVLISLLVGVSLGALAGYLGGRVDDMIMFLVNTVWSIPTLLLVFAIVLVFGRGVGIIFLAVGLTMWVDVARIVRGQVLSIKEMQYVEAAQAFGFSKFRILFRHILPNTLGPVMVVAAANFATAILLEAGLGYLGFGVQAPTPSWGTMLNEHYGFAMSGKPLLALVPALAVMLLVLSFNLVGNGLRDALDVRAK